MTKKKIITDNFIDTSKIIPLISNVSITQTPGIQFQGSYLNAQGQSISQAYSRIELTNSGVTFVMTSLFPGKKFYLKQYFIVSQTATYSAGRTFYMSLGRVKPGGTFSDFELQWVGSYTSNFSLDIPIRFDDALVCYFPDYTYITGGIVYLEFYGWFE